MIIRNPRLRKAKANRKLPDKAEIYRLLAERYGWTFEQIADMNRMQQYAAMQLTEKEKITTFSSLGEYHEWHAKNKSSFQ